MHIRVVNPNTSAAMTAKIEHCARSVIGAGTVLDAVSPGMGPASIESHYDEALSVPGILTEIARGEDEGVDAWVIACFGDPGLDAARERASGPVVGIAEAAMHAASFLGRGFSIVTTLGRTTGRARDLAAHYGFARHCLGVHACEIPVLDLDENPDTRKVVTESCRVAAEADGADVIVLGCAGMTDLCAHIAAEIGVPVVDGVAAGTKLVEALVTLGLRKSGRGEFATPPAKSYTGLLREFGS